MNLETLEEFVYLADSLSYRETAEHFYVSRSVISRHMSALEGVVGARLLDRDSRGVKLTRAGEVFYREANIILRDWALALERTGSTNEDGRTLVRIGYLRNGARPFLASFVQHMAETHPEISLSLACMDYGELRRALAEHSVDLAFAINVDPAISQNYRSTKIYDDCFYGVFSHQHHLAEKTEGLTIDDLRNQKLMLPESYINAGLAGFLNEFADDDSVKEAIPFYNDLDALYLKVQTEGYVAFFSGLNKESFGDRLASLPILGVDTSFTESAFYHDDFQGAAYDACLEGVEWCRDSLRKRS